MNALGVRLLWVGAVAVVLAASGIGMGPCSVFASGKSSGVTGTERRPWIMVTLTSSPSSESGRRTRSVIKRLSGNPNGVIRHYSAVTRELMEEMNPEFIVLSPQGTPWCRYRGSKGVALQNFLWLIPLLAEEMNIPMLGICGGHQALALAFGGRVGPIRGRAYDCMPYSRDRQLGLVPLEVMAPDPIFMGIHKTIHISQSHFDEVKILPPGFVLLASEKLSPNQIIRHPTLPVYGIQGHAERFTRDHPEGVVLIRNFLEIAGTFNATVRGFQTALPKLLSFRRPGILFRHAP